MPFRQPIAAPPPYANRPMRWAAPPAGPGSPESQTIPEPLRVITQITFAVNIAAGGSVNSAFPVGQRVVSQPFTSPVGIVAVSFSTSAVNATTDGVIAMWVSRDTGTSQSIISSTDIMVDHLVESGLSHSMRSGVAFSDDVAPKYGSGEKMAIYIAAAGTGFANNLMLCAATVRFFPLL